jgi:hypothetical protein
MNAVVNKHGLTGDWGLEQATKQSQRALDAICRACLDRRDRLHTTRGLIGVSELDRIAQQVGYSATWDRATRTGIITPDDGSEPIHCVGRKLKTRS